MLIIQRIPEAGQFQRCMERQLQARQQALPEAAIYGDFNTRTAAMILMGISGDPIAFDYLRMCLLADDESLRANAILSIGDLIQKVRPTVKVQLALCRVTLTDSSERCKQLAAQVRDDIPKYWNVEKTKPDFLVDKTFLPPKSTPLTFWNVFQAMTDVNRFDGEEITTERSDEELFEHMLELLQMHENEESTEESVREFCTRFGQFRDGFLRNPETGPDLQAKYRAKIESDPRGDERTIRTNSLITELLDGL